MGKKNDQFSKKKKLENKVQKLTNFTEKKGLFGPKKQAGAELKKKKKDLLGQKLGEKLSIRDKKLPIFQKKKKGIFWVNEKQAWA